MPIGRYVAMPVPRKRPGACFFTGRSSEDAGPYVDTGQDLPNHGVIYVSRGALLEMLAAADKLSPPPETDQAISEEQIRAEAYAAGYQDATNVVKGMFHGFADDLRTDPGTGDPSLDVSPAVSDLQAFLEVSGKQEGGDEGNGEPPVDDDAAPRSKKHRGVSGNDSDARNDSIAL